MKPSDETMEAEKEEAVEPYFKTEQEEESSFSQIESLEKEQEKDWFSLKEELRPCIVEIYCGDSRGSGIVWEVTEEGVTLISAGHLLKKAETCDVVCYKGIFYTAQVTGFSEKGDVGFAFIPAEDYQGDDVRFQATGISRRKAEELEAGEELAVYGSMDYIAGNFVEAYLIEAETELELPVYEEKQMLLVGGVRREYTGAEEEDTLAEIQNPDEKNLIDAGMSGSGVFDKAGCLLGILVGGDEEEHFAAVPVWRIG